MTNRLKDPEEDCGSSDDAAPARRNQSTCTRYMNPTQARAIYTTFVVSKWMYGCFLVPFTEETARKIEAIDDAFISAVVGACRRNDGKGRRLDPARSNVAKMRALLRLDSPYG